VDDAHHADRDAGLLLDRLARIVSAPQHLAVLTRRLPEGAERLRRAEFAYLHADDLRLRPEEVLQVCRSGFGLEIAEGDGETLLEATGGWTEAVVLAAARARRTGESVAVVAAATGGSSAPTAVAAILEEAVAALSPEERSALAQVARLPQLDRATVELAGGRRASSTGRWLSACRSPISAVAAGTSRVRSGTSWPPWPHPTLRYCGTSPRHGDGPMPTWAEPCRSYSPPGRGKKRPLSWSRPLPRYLTAWTSSNTSR
jgi:hypothetical protein